MKVKSLVLAVAMVAIAVVGVRAEKPTGYTPQPANTNSHTEIEETSSILTPVDINTESKVQELKFIDSTINNYEYINLFFRMDYFTDTTNFNGLKIYIGGIKPIIRKLNLQDIEKIEIL